MDDNKTPEELSAEQRDSIPLQPVPQGEPAGGGHFTRNLLLVAGASFVTYFLVSSTPQACRGATRSSKLRWQQQQEEITRAELKANAEQEFSK